jgi:hypothetical protein
VLDVTCESVEEKGEQLKGEERVRIGNSNELNEGERRVEELLEGQAVGYLNS